MHAYGECAEIGKRIESCRERRKQTPFFERFRAALEGGATDRPRLTSPPQVVPNPGTICQYSYSNEHSLTVTAIFNNTVRIMKPAP